MQRALSFRMVRNLGLGTLTVLILVVSLFAFFMLKRIDAKIGLVMEKERPSLDAVLKTQNSFVEIYPYFQRYIAGRLDSYQHIPQLIENVERHFVTAKINLPSGERVYLRRFGINLKYLKYTLNTYNEEIQYDPTSSNAAEMSEIVSRKMNEANDSLNILVANIRRRIQLMDMEILQGIQKDRRVLFMFLLLAVVMGLAVMVIINRALATPVHQLMEGAKKIGNGNLDWQIESEFKDEFGQLAASFNNMAERLGQTQAQLLQSGKLASIGQLAAGVSHELNNPLGGILGYSQFILEMERRRGLENIGAEGLKNIFTYVGYIERESQRCKSIVANLLKFSRASETDIVPLDINQVLEETLVFTRHQLEINQVEVVQELAPDLPRIVGNEHQLQQVFTNIMLNAQQAMPGGGKLTVRTAVNDGLLEIAFADTGTGIPREHLDKLFDPFFTTKESGEGTGLGLSVSYGIIQAHQGKIEVESRVGKGTTFRIKLPFEPAGEKGATTSAEGRVHHGHEGSE